MNSQTYPSCCGSEDGNVVLGVDPASDDPDTTPVVAWACNTCGALTVLTRPPATT